MPLHFHKVGSFGLLATKKSKRIMFAKTTSIMRISWKSPPFPGCLVRKSFQNHANDSQAIAVATVDLLSGTCHTVLGKLQI